MHAVDKKRARLNCISHLLALMPYEEIPRKKIALPKRERHPEYSRTPTPDDMVVPQRY